MGAHQIHRLEYGEDVAKAAQDAESWGFPRSVEPAELSRADWFRIGSTVVFWLDHLDTIPTYFVHIAVKPSARRRWNVRGWLRWIEQYAATQGAEELGFIRCDGSEHSEGYLRRLGWREVHYGLAKALPVYPEAA